ncbi:class I SAM-dependent methyltransferase [Flavobacterium filum]|uniref:class I SAM-dependent methyltransferase n=1 Tax=Flavobacterium filum TaxID=370974 RepID=UPI0023F0AC9F|nr:class I SAM-dependent methyltransferase [Flavobacterium filum]
MQETKYDKIGTGYNSTRQADPYLTERLLYHLQPQNDRLYLDIGCGTGNYTCTLADKGLNFIGVEPSEKMLKVAKSKNQDIKWLNGTAEQIPAEDKTFDGIIATLTIHHWKDINKAFAELNRVLEDNGRIVMFTSTPEQMKGYWLNHYFPKMLYSSIVQMPSLDVIRKATNESKLKINGIEKYFIKDYLKDCFLYVGKNSPERYFDEQIRHGISSFSSLANFDEVKQGLTELRNDIDNNAFEQIKDQYENDLGDYLFITIEKKGST